MAIGLVTFLMIELELSVKFFGNIKYENNDIEIIGRKPFYQRRKESYENYIE